MRNNAEPCQIQSRRCPRECPRACQGIEVWIRLGGCPKGFPWAPQGPRGPPQGSIPAMSQGIAQGIPRGISQDTPWRLPGPQGIPQGSFRGSPLGPPCSLHVYPMESSRGSLLLVLNQPGSIDDFYQVAPGSILNRIRLFPESVQTRSSIAPLARAHFCPFFFIVQDWRSKLVCSSLRSRLLSIHCPQSMWMFSRHMLLNNPLPQPDDGQCCL